MKYWHEFHSLSSLENGTFWRVTSVYKADILEAAGILSAIPHQ
jgi:hypothetical protein